MTKPITICFACRHHRNTMGDRNDPEAWYNQRCTHTDLKHEREIDPVTGNLIYGLRGSLGATSPNDRLYPYCRELNDGHCKYYEVKIEEG